MRCLFNLLRIKGFYMFQALLAHPQEAVCKQHLVYCVRVMSVGCTKIGVEHSNHDITRTQYTNCVYAVSPEDVQVMLETCRGP
jgi:hypothetical protein